MSASVDDIKNIIDELEQVAEERIRAEERYKRELAVLKEFGCDSIEEAEKEYARIMKKLNKRKKAFIEAYEYFTEDYSELLDK